MNTVNLKVTWIVNEQGINELYFDFCNKEGLYVGNVIISGKGKLSWYIMNLEYKDNILELVNYIMGNNDKRKVQDETNDEDSERWNRVRLYAYSRNLVLNFQQNDEYVKSLHKRYY